MAPPSSSPGLLQKFIGTLAGKTGSGDAGSGGMDRVARLGLSARQQELNQLWNVYRNTQYSARKIGWDGKEATGRLDTDFISTQGYLPPGFMDQSKAGGSALPLKFRRPSAPYALVKVIVDRFTGLLFSESRHPEIKVDGDDVTQDWLRALAETTRLWQQMIQARTFGGAMGAVCVGFQFVNGKPVIEVHDPRWCFPEFSEHGSLALKSLEKRYTYPKEERDPSTGRWQTVQYWYRRVIDETSDVLYAPARVDQGNEPEWFEEKRADHNFGFCPVLWTQNMPLQDSEDGDPDCSSAVYENSEAIDALIAQANRGILMNCDPTLILTTKAEFQGISVGSDNAIRVPDGDAKFLELQASGPKAALDLAAQLREHILEMASCVLEHPDVAGKTATEVQRNYEAMLAKADVLREQYGQRLVIPLLEMMWRGANQLYQPKLIPVPGFETPGQETQHENAGAGTLGSNPLDGVLTQTPMTVRSTVLLPPRYEKGVDGITVAVERQLGTGGTISLKWPGYFQATPQDLQAAVLSTSTALSGGIIDDETAITYIAPFFKTENVADLIDRVRTNAGQAQADLMAQMQSGTRLPETHATEIPPTEQ